VLVACATVSCVLAVVIGSRVHARWDVTGSREFTLSERTRRVLARVEEATTIIVSAPLASLDRSTRQRVGDLLSEFERSSGRIRATWIDTGSSAGPAEFAALMGSISGPFEATLTEQKEALESAAGEARLVAEGMRRSSDLLKALAEAGDAATPRYFSATGGPRDQAGLARTVASSVDEAAEAIGGAAGQVIGGVSLPAVDTAREGGREPLEKAARAASAMAEFAESILAQGGPEGVKTAAGAVRDVAAAMRDRAARAADALSKLKMLDPLVVARVLERTSAVLVTSPAGTIALDFATLFPSGPMAEAGGEASREALFKGEQMIATALSSLGQASSPIVVFVHAQSVRLLDEEGEPTGPGLAAFRRLFDRMRLTRTTPAEWAVALEAGRPDLAGLDAKGDRPVVWVVLGAPPRVTVDARQTGSAAERGARIGKLGSAVRTLIEAGEHVLVCIEPSDLPSLGEVDPVAKAVEAMGVKVDSSRPLLRRESSPEGVMVWAHLALGRAERGQEIGQAIDGVRTVLPWATAMSAVEGGGARVSPLLAEGAGGDVWGESQWMMLRDLVGRGLARPLSPLLLAEPPTAEAGRDLVKPEWSDRFVVAAASERDRGAKVALGRWMREGMPQRMVVVGSPEWLMDGYSQASEDVGGRRALLFPGNLELFDASVAWLAGRDDEIAPGPRARDVARIGAMSDGALRAVRLFLVVGVPALVLIVGAVVRLVRG
jgi:hypothetical protein